MKTYLVETRRSGGGLCPSWAVPDEAIAVSEVVQAVVVVLLKMLHDGGLYNGISLVRRTLGAVVGHEADKGIVKLINRLEVVQNLVTISTSCSHHQRFARAGTTYLADVGVNAFYHACKTLHGSCRFGSLLWGHVLPFR